MGAYVPQPIEVPALPGPALLLLILGSYPPRTESTAGRTHRNRHTEPSRPVFPGPSSVFSRRQRRSLKNRHLRSVSEKCGGRRHLQELDELASVQRGNVAIELAWRRRRAPEGRRRIGSRPARQRRNRAGLPPPCDPASADARRGTRLYAPLFVERNPSRAPESSSGGRRV